jgi:hypothetical protein
MGVAARDVLEWIVRMDADPLCQHPGDVVGDVRAANIRLHECMADEDVKIEIRGDAQGGRGVEHAAEDLLEVEHFAQCIWVVPELGHAYAFSPSGEHFGEEIEVGSGEPITACSYPCFQHSYAFTKT